MSVRSQSNHWITKERFYCTSQVIAPMMDAGTWLKEGCCLVPWMKDVCQLIGFQANGVPLVGRIGSMLTGVAEMITEQAMLYSVGSISSLGVGK